ncbi:MAG: alkene reductase [Pseudomonadales bacterium]|nr:alkene reductase [Pseudomonadales bacterium]
MKSSQQSPLFSSFKLGPYTLNNRIIMAPLTRSRASDEQVPQPMMLTYYEQRASAGLIISEASQVSAQGAGYANTPGIYNDEQIIAWKQITDAVHDKGGRIFLQLWHVGRISKPELQPNNATPVAPSAIKPAGDYITPRALELEEINSIINDFRLAAENAKKAGFDGVEIHAANGYLLDQFLRDSTNHRGDSYGGSIANRARLTLEVTKAVVEVWGSDKVGIRLSPINPFNDISDSNPEALFTYVIEQLNPLNLAYLHMVEMAMTPPIDDSPVFDVASLKKLYQGVYMANGGYNKTTAIDVIENEPVELVSFGELYIANLDLPARFRNNAPLNPVDESTKYGGNEKGYIDYPALV